MDDRALAEGCRRGDRAAWDEFISKYTRFLTFAIRKQLRDPDETLVQDILQNVFVELLKDDRRAWRRYDPKYRLTTWLGLVVLTHVDRHHRARRPAPLPDRMEELTAEMQSAPGAQEEVRKAMECLSDKERLVIALFYEDGQGLKEIEAVTGIPSNTVGSLLLRGREKMKQKLGKQKTE